jgi:large subunit ribosomal protein L17
MRHRVKKTTLNADTKHRKAILRNGVRNLITHGAIITTRPRAKEVQRLADKLIYKAKRNSLSTKRQLHRFFGKRDVVSVLCERIAPVFTQRNSGFSRITKYGRRRGDNTLLYKLELVAKPDKMGFLTNPDKNKAKTPKKNVDKTKIKTPKKSVDKTKVKKTVKKPASKNKKPAQKSKKTTPKITKKS